MRHRASLLLVAGALIASSAACNGWSQVGFDMTRRSFNPHVENVRRDGFAIPSPVYQFPVTVRSEPFTGGGMVFTVGGPTGGSQLHALDIDDGTPLWSADCTDTTVGGTISAGSYLGDVVVASCSGTQSAVTGRDAATGELRWERPGSRGAGTHAGLILTTRTDDTVVEALYADGSVAWSTAVGFDPGMMYADGATVWIRHGATLSAYDVRDGTFLRDLPSHSGTLHSIANGRLVYYEQSWGGDTTSITVVDAATGAVLWEHVLGPCVGTTVMPQFLSVAVSDDVVAYGANTANHHRCAYGALDLESGTLLWETEPTHNSFEIVATIADGAVFFHGLTSFTNLSPVFAVVRLSDGQILFSTDTTQGGSTGAARVVVANEMFFIRGSAWRFGDVIIPY